MTAPDDFTRAAKCRPPRPATGSIGRLQRISAAHGQRLDGERLFVCGCVSVRLDGGDGEDALLGGGRCGPAAQRDKAEHRGATAGPIRSACMFGSPSKALRRARRSPAARRQTWSGSQLFAVSTISSSLMSINAYNIFIRMYKSYYHRLGIPGGVPRAFVEHDALELGPRRRDSLRPRRAGRRTPCSTSSTRSRRRRWG